MNSKVGWIWAVVLALVAGLAIAWFVSRGADPRAPLVEPRPVAPGASPGTPAQAAPLEEASRSAGAILGEQGAREPSRGNAPAKEPEQGEAVAEADPEPAEEVAVDPVKWETLEPIQGGVAAIRARHAGVPYEERLRRSHQLENAFAMSDLESQAPPESYAALKDELVWLRENLGTPPAKPPKK